MAQPVDYLRVVVHDTLHTFDWNRQPDPYNYYGNSPAFRFGPYGCRRFAWNGVSMPPGSMM